MEGPSTCMTVLEIELDLLALQTCFLQEKFDCIAALLETWSTKKHCTQNELESLIGNLQQACKVIPQGYTLLWCMMNLLSAFWLDNHPIRLNQEFPWTCLGGVRFFFHAMVLLLALPCGILINHSLCNFTAVETWSNRSHVSLKAL